MARGPLERRTSSSLIGHSEDHCVLRHAALDTDLHLNSNHVQGTLQPYELATKCTAPGIRGSLHFLSKDEMLLDSRPVPGQWESVAELLA